MDAVILLGHGSMRPEANESLFRMAELVRDRLPGTHVEPCFMQFGTPDFHQGADACIRAGARRVVVQPYFLAAGDHVRKDIPAMIEKAAGRHPAAAFVAATPLGLHEALASVVADRVAEALGTDPVEGDLREVSPGDIEAESFRIIDTELGRRVGTPAEHAVTRRIIHATGDFSFAENIRFHSEATACGIRAIRAGRNILVDVEMARAGISTGLLEEFGGRVVCRVADPDVAEEAARRGRTRSEVAMERAADDDIGIVAMGNAPTALGRAMELIDGGLLSPDLVVGVPVGFVNAAEQKRILSQKDYPFITVLGRRGGTPVAVAAVNALIRLAKEDVE